MASRPLGTYVHDLFTSPLVKANGEHGHMYLTCTCPKCNREFEFDGNVRILSYNPVYDRTMGEAHCPYCSGISHVDCTDIQKASQGPLEVLPLLLNSPNAIARYIVHFRLKHNV